MNEKTVLTPETEVDDSVFCPADERILSHLKERIESQAPAFIGPLNLLGPECAAVAYMLDRIVNSFGDGPGRKTFFCNSHIEAIQGAVKLARHHCKKKDNGSDGKVLFFDETGAYRNFFDLRGENTADISLLPGVDLVQHLDDLATRIGERRYRIVLVSVRNWPGASLDAIAEACRKKDLVGILDTSKTGTPDRWKTDKASLVPWDIVCWGEGLANDHVPFGAFSASGDIHRVWDNPRNCFLHSTTFGGNAAVLSYVRLNLYKAFPIFMNDPRHRRYLKNITDSAEAAATASARYINSALPKVFGSLSLNEKFESALGASIVVRRKKGKKTVYMDCIGGSGCNVFGHNLRGIADDVLETHAPGYDYFGMLNALLYSRTGLPKMFQAVSGASAVEAAITISLLAHRKAGKILTFQNNFGGKTLVALNVTGGNHSLFAPLYGQVVTFDVNRGTPEELRKLLAAGDIAVVWMEAIQGRTMTAIPAEFIDIINSYKEEYGYIIGVDEILNGIERTGSFTSFDPKMLRPDVITFAKGLSGMVLPISVALFSEQVYRNALARNDALVNALSRLYRNQLSCHVAAYVLERAEKEDIKDNVRRMSRYLGDALARMTAGNALIKRIEAHGLHIHIHLNKNKFPFRWWSYEKTLACLTRVAYKRGNVLCLFGRLLPPLDLDKRNADRIIAGLGKALSVHPLLYFWTGLKISIYKRFR